MPYREKRIYSGAMLEIERRHCHPCGRVIERKGRGLPTGKAQARLNLRAAQLRLMRLMCENFTKGDFHLTLCFEKLGERAEQQAALAKALRSLRGMCKKRTGEELRYICVREDRGVRPHYHLVCGAFGLGLDELAGLWPHGRIEMGTLDGCPDYGWLARYLTKQEDQDKNKKRWSQSKNLRQPVEQVRVLKRKALAHRPQVPKGYYVLSAYHQATAAGYEWEYVVAIRADRRQELPLEVQLALEERGSWGELAAVE